MEAALKSANELAVLLRDRSWYHRTSVLEECLNNPCTGRCVSSRFTLQVWGEGERPAGLPTEFKGYLVAYCRVTEESPCPFGSVKK